MKQTVTAALSRDLVDKVIHGIALLEDDVLDRENRQALMAMFDRAYLVNLYFHKED